MTYGTDVAASATRMAGDAEQAVRAAAADLGVKVDLERLVYGWSSGGAVAFAPAYDLPDLTEADVAKGATVGVLVAAPGEDDAKVRGGLRLVYSATTGQLVDGDGATVATSDIQAVPIPANRRPASASVEVGGVTVTVGWLYICFDWDDPPGTPGGMCHQTCYGWH
ncbi:hypothetical protein [Actinokineospora sp. HUAS TT18]|uniref:hypothetical protein n=1 Tax=Actinokineospora sp. HUAS TT18 TaxID=3447451 RepID=UPI003F528985